MKIALIDDEQIYLNEMTQICKEFGEKYQCQIDIYTFQSGLAFLDALKDQTFAIVFMDIYMKDLDGVTTALKLRLKDHQCILIFLTSSSEFMPEAFSCHAFEYIVKPLTTERVMKVLQDALKILPISSKSITIFQNRKPVTIYLNDILYVMSDAHYLNIYLLNDRILRPRMTLSNFMKLIDYDLGFIMINKGILVNAEYVISFHNNVCVLKNDIQFPIHTRNKNKIEKALQTYHFEKMHYKQRYYH